MKQKTKFLMAAAAAMLISFAASDVSAQSGSRSGSGSRSVAPSPGFSAPAQAQAPGQPNLANFGQGEGYDPALGSGLIGAQKEGCNCFQLPEFDHNAPEPYDRFASQNYWDLCPPTTLPSNNFNRRSLPQLDFNRLIPLPRGGLFGRR